MAIPDKYKRPTVQVRRGDGLSGGFVIAALLACAFGIGVVIAGYFWMSSRSPSVADAVSSPTRVESPAASDAAASATGRIEAPQPPAPIDDGSWTDSDIRACKEEATAAADVAKRRRLEAVSQDRVGLGGPDPGIVERATYLLCGATTKPLHLCKDYWRNWFMTAIKAYAKEFREVSMSSYWTKVHVAERAQRGDDEFSQGEWQTITDDLDQTTREVATMHEEIVAAFRSLVKDGIIVPEDFGVFFGFGIPYEITKMIGDAKPLRDRCE